MKTSLGRPPIGAITLAGLLTIGIQAGCSDEAPANSTAGSSGAAGTSSGGAGSAETEDGLRLEALSAEILASVGPYVAPDNNKVFYARLKISNGTEDSIPVSPVQFRLRSSDGLERLADVEIFTQLSQGCATDAFLSPGAEITCDIAFGLQFGLTAEDLVYQRADGELVVLPLNLDFACAECGRRCVDTRSDRAHCGSCGNALIDNWTCVNGEASCSLTICGENCVDTNSDPMHCGNCNTPVPPGGTCSAGIPGCGSFLTDCGGTCLNTSNDLHNCGSCGNSCYRYGYGPGADCRGGACFLEGVVSDFRVTGDSICASLGLNCVAAKAVWKDRENDGSWDECYGKQESQTIECGGIPMEEQQWNDCVLDFYFVAADCRE